MYVYYHYTFITIYGKTFEGENFHGFCGFFVIPRKFSCVCFTVSVRSHYHLTLLG